MNPYLSGHRLYGEDLTEAERMRWYEDEREAYATLSTSGNHYGEYKYHALNIEHGFRHLPQRRFRRVLGIGSALGDEFEPIKQRCEEITILEPSEALTNPRFRYVRPETSGKMSFSDRSFDLVTCLSALHHIPNVSTVLGEIARVLDLDGYALVTEPITSMGDWRSPRPGLTKHERGIPLKLFRPMLETANLKVVREHLVCFSLTNKLSALSGASFYSNPTLVKLDSWACSLPWRISYHAESPIEKLRPTGIYYVLQKMR
jgi:SAM-dependent methyltransferase